MNNSRKLAFGILSIVLVSAIGLYAQKKMQAPLALPAAPAPIEPEESIDLPMHTDTAPVLSSQATKDLIASLGTSTTTTGTQHPETAMELPTPVHVEKPTEELPIERKEEAPATAVMSKLESIDNKLMSIESALQSLSHAITGLSTAPISVAAEHPAVSEHPISEMHPSEPEYMMHEENNDMNMDEMPGDAINDFDQMNDDENDIDL